MSGHPRCQLITFKSYLMIRLSLLICLLTCSIVAFGQLHESGMPVADRHDLPAAEAVEMPGIDVPALMAEDAVDLNYNLPLRFAFPHPVSLNLNNSGTWTQLREGRVWRLSIRCPEALNINFLYDDFYMPPGATLFLYNKQGTQTIGAFTANNNKASGRFATGLVEGSTVTLEYFEPNEVYGQGRLQIAQVGHGYRHLNGETNDEDEKVSGPCQVNVNCEEGDNWQDEKKGVARIVMDGLYLCSGSLVTNTANDCKPLFLTANHCLMGGIKQDAIVNPDVSGYVFYWNYEYAGCDNSGPLPEQTTSGGTVLANAGIMETGMHTLLSSDFALIELDENPRGAYDVYFNGWDATGEQGNTGVGIHHPAGDAKKISTHSVTPEFDGYYWALYWDPTVNGHSVTEGGSSGSALFREDGTIIGQLFGGGSVNCDDPANDLGLYGQLSYSWTNDDDLLSSDARRRLDVWLDPIGQGSIRKMTGTYDPCEVPMVYFNATSATVSEEATTTNAGCRAYTDYEYQLGITPYPTQPVDVLIQATGSAAAGSALDYELLTESVSFNNVTNSQTFTVRVYDDAYPEGEEHVQFSFIADGGSLNVGVLDANGTQELIITSADAVPATHVQTVRNVNAPAEEHLGPFGTVYFTDPGSGGIMMALTNESAHDFGCVKVMIDKPGSTANNSWATGTMFSKTFRVDAENPASAPLTASLYLDDNELTGWEWFNNEGWDAEDALAYQFDGAANTSNESSAQELVTGFASYGSDTRLDVSLSGLDAVSGFGVGRLSTTGGFTPWQENGNSTALTAELRPNVTSDRTTLAWNAPANGTVIIRILDLQGREVNAINTTVEQGFNTTDITTAGWTAGLYFVQVLQDGQAATTLRLIKQ